MEIRDLNGLGPPKKIEKNSLEKVPEKKGAQKNKTNIKQIQETDKVEISEESKQLQNSEDEIKVAKELLAKLPTVRAHIIYEALAKLKVGVYSSDEIIAEAAARLLQSGELSDLL